MKPRPPSRLRWFIAGFAFAVLLTPIVLLALLSAAEVAANRAASDDYRTVIAELRAIASSLKSHHDSRDRYPATFNEWRETEPKLDELLTTRSAATEPRYFIDLAALGDPERIVTMVPSRDLDKYIPDVPFTMWRMLMRSAQRPQSQHMLMGDLGDYRSGSEADAAKRREFAYRAGWSFDEHDPD